MKKLIATLLVTSLVLSTLGMAVLAEEPTTRGQGIYPDVVSTASVNLTTEEAIQNSLGATGTWITTLGSNVTVTKDLLWTGDIRKNETTLGRKLGLYYHSSPNIGGEQLFTLKVPVLIVAAENAKLAYGTLDGNVRVQAKG
ncbi:MAG: hypothetical protein K0R80_3123, partial [Clostridia bacterium]|nr:hypothetical protein [Clostridia bacterium]